MIIEGPLWFVGAVLVCGAHLLYLRGWRREQRQYHAWWKTYDADARARHEEFMRAIGGGDETAWRLDGSRERGQA